MNKILTIVCIIIIVISAIGVITWTSSYPVNTTVVTVTLDGESSGILDTNVFSHGITYEADEGQFEALKVGHTYRFKVHPDAGSQDVLVIDQVLGEVTTNGNL